MNDDTIKQHVISLEGEEMGEHFGADTSFKTDCPSCSKTLFIYTYELEYAKVGKEYEFNGYCTGCDHEWVIGTVSAEVNIIVTENITPEEGA